MLDEPLGTSGRSVDLSTGRKAAGCSSSSPGWPEFEADLMGERTSEGLQWRRGKGWPATAASAHGPRTVHPRVCGEHHWGCVILSPVTGSSPRVRGTRLEPYRENGLEWFDLSRV